MRAWTAMLAMLIIAGDATANAQVTQQWATRYGGGSARAISIDGAGHVYVTGQSCCPQYSGAWGFRTVAYDAESGAQLWTAHYADGAGGSFDTANAIAVDDAGHVYVTGLSFSDATGNGWATVAYDASTGAQLWVGRVSPPPGRWATPTAVAVDLLGHVYVTGGSGVADDPRAFEAVTVAYDAVTGAELWTTRYRAVALGSSATALAVDDAGHVYVTGRTQGELSHHFNYLTLAYDAETGAQLWVSRYERLGGDDTAHAIGLDGAGAVYITGESLDDAGLHVDYATVAYDAATGVQLWVARYSGPPNADNHPVGLALDHAGQVYVTGFSTFGDASQYATIAYESVTGTELWAAQYNGSDNQRDRAYAVAADGVGGVYVTGESYVSADARDAATVAYDAATGTVRWAARYRGPFPRGSTGTTLAVDDMSNVYVTGVSDGGPGSPNDFVTIRYSQP